MQSLIEVEQSVISYGTILPPVLSTAGLFIMQDYQERFHTKKGSRLKLFIDTFSVIAYLR